MTAPPPWSAPCPHLARCGGCDRMRQPPDAARADRVASVERAVGYPVNHVLAGPRTEGWRARLRLRPGPDGRLGFTRPGTHQAVPIDACAVARPELSALLGQLPPLPGLDTVELRSAGGGVALVAASRAQHGARKGTRAGAPGPARAALMALKGRAFDGAELAGVALDGDFLFGDPRLRLPLAGLSMQIGPGSFFQANLEVNAQLVAAVAARVKALGAARVLDLYAGVGNLSLPLARRGTPVTLIESNPAAVADAGATAKAHALAGVEVRRGDADRFQAGDAFFDVALLDPPRVGAPGLLPRLLLTRPRALLYVSCNPVALGRDLGALTGGDYRVAEVAVLDMFPHTHHAEVLCTVLRKGVDLPPMPDEAGLRQIAAGADLGEPAAAR